MTRYLLVLCATACTTSTTHPPPLPSMNSELHKGRMSSTGAGPCDARTQDIAGTLQWLDTFQYDGSGRLMLDTTYQPNGDVVATDTTSYNALGDLFETHYHSVDGTYDERDTYTYDVHGLNVGIQYATDTNNDGQDDYVEVRTNDFNAIGEKMVAHVDKYGDGSIDSLITYSHDDLGRDTGNVKDDHLDGTIDRVTTVDYDDEAGVITISQTFAGYTPDQWTITYSADGRILTNHWTYGNREQIPEGMMVYEYSCP